MDTWTYDTVMITTELEKVDREKVYDYLHHHSYWSRNIPRETLNTAIDNSVNFSVFYQGEDQEDQEDHSFDSSSDSSSESSDVISDKISSENSSTFIGFGRLVTDYSTASYLCDVFILPEYQGRGFGKYLIKSINDWIEQHQLRTSLLLTRDAQGLYSQYDWVHPTDLQRVMRYKESNPDFYST